MEIPANKKKQVKYGKNNRIKHGYLKKRRHWCYTMQIMCLNADIRLKNRITKQKICFHI